MRGNNDTCNMRIRENNKCHLSYIPISYLGYVSLSSCCDLSGMMIVVQKSIPNSEWVSSWYRHTTHIGTLKINTIHVDLHRRLHLNDEKGTAAVFMPCFIFFTNPLAS